MTALTIRNAIVWDSISDADYPAAVVIDRKTIAMVIRKGEPEGDTPPETIDAQGNSLMPGMVEGHCHPSFVGINGPAELGQISPAQHMLLPAKKANLLFRHGFTSIHEAASPSPPSAP